MGMQPRHRGWDEVKVRAELCEETTKGKLDFNVRVCVLV